MCWSLSHASRLDLAPSSSIRSGVVVVDVVDAAVATAATPHAAADAAAAAVAAAAADVAVTDARFFWLAVPIYTHRLRQRQKRSPKPPRLLLPRPRQAMGKLPYSAAPPLCHLTS